MDVGHAVEEVLEHHLDLHPSEVGTETEVGTATAERHVRVWGAARRRTCPASSNTSASRFAEMWKNTTFSSSPICVLTDHDRGVV